MPKSLANFFARAKSRGALLIVNLLSNVSGSIIAISCGGMYLLINKKVGSISVPLVMMMSLMWLAMFCTGLSSSSMIGIAMMTHWHFAWVVIDGMLSWVLKFGS